MNDLAEPSMDLIKASVSQRQWQDVREHLSHLEPPDIAELLLELEHPDRAIVFRLLPRQLSSDVFSYIDPEHGDELLNELGTEEARQLIANLSPDDRTALFEELPAEVTQRLMTFLSGEDLKQARALLGYPEGSVGRLMTPRYCAVRSDWTVEFALKHIRATGDKGETVNVIYVTDPKGALLDVLSLKRFVFAVPDTVVAEMMDHNFVSISAFEPRQEAVRMIQHYDLHSLPVVDSEGVLLGIVTFDDVMDVAEEEATEDFHKMGSVSALNLSLRDARPSLLYRKRVGWLVMLVFINIFGGAGIAYFEETIEAVVALVFFLPLVVDSAGNAGTQSATLMVRALATGDVKAGDWIKMWGKELSVATALGITMGLAVSALGLWRGGPEVAMAVAAAMVLVVIMGSMIGMLLPFVLARYNLDPATASAPLITSIADVAGILIYFSIATMVLTLPPPG